MKTKSSSNRGGFTLIEMLVVIAIIVLLASMLFPAILNALETARRNTARAEAKSIAASINVFFNDYSYFPVPMAMMGTSDNPEGDEALSRGIIQTLLAIDAGDNSGHALNTRRRIYLTMDRISNDGTLLDPWRNQYLILLDLNLDNQITFNGENYRAKVIVYSTAGGAPPARWVSSVN